MMDNFDKEEGRHAKRIKDILAEEESNMIAGEEKSVSAVRLKDIFAEENLFAVEEEMPAREENSPAEEENLPGEEEKMPAQEENLPGEEEKMPAREENSPAGEEEIPAQEENPPGEEDELSAVEKLISVEEIRRIFYSEVKAASADERMEKHPFFVREKAASADERMEKHPFFVREKAASADEGMERHPFLMRGKEKATSAGTMKEIINFVLYIGVVLLVTYLVIHYVGQRTEVSGSSMLNTLTDGDNLIVDKITYRFKDPERFDIIVFPYKYEENTYYIKRIIGMPGETVRIDENGVIYINGEELQESYGRQVIRADRLGLAANEITLGDDEYFVLGDNRNESSDSREPSVGNIKREDIIGRAWLRIYPFDKIGFIRHQ